MAVFQLIREQKINSSVEELWEFISSPKNLKTITPDYMGFDITTQNLPGKMYEGMIISYKVSPLLGIKSTWVTEITHIEENTFFVDEQRVGPYKMWHHEHFIFPQPNGVLMKDIVTYQPPFGILGQLSNSLIIKHKLNEIFEYRRKKMIEIFAN